MKTSFMRLIIFFDLQMSTKREVRIYTRFHKWLISNGYMMMQYSIYCKIFANRDSALKHLQIVRKSVPKTGQVRAMLITEKQYSSIYLLSGVLSSQEETVQEEGFMLL